MIRICAIGLIILSCAATTGLADVKVLVIPKGSKATFWQSVDKGARKAGKDLAINITVRGPYTEDQHEAQVRIIEFGIREHYDAIVLAPNHVTESGPALKQAVAKGIKVVIIDSRMDAHHHACFIESDNYRAGQMAAHHIAALLGNAGNVILARHLRNHASTTEREQGFSDIIAARYPEINVVAAPYIGSSMGAAYHRMMALFGRLSNIDAIFSVGEEATLGVLRAIKKRGLQGKVRFVGFDFNPVIGEAILSGDMHATIAQDPYQIGYLGVKTAYQLTRDEKVPAKIHTDTILIDAQNYNTVKIQNIINANMDRDDLY